jgi:GMP synthase (glutamine-hydrolysing)
MHPRPAATLRYLLLQSRDRDDPIREQEVCCFARALECDAGRIDVVDLIHEVPAAARLRAADVVLMGGSGDYSVAAGGPWLDGALDAMHELYELAIPTFASCWGFQALARALGGEVVTDLARAEVGTFEIQLTAAGRRDPLFGPLGERFLAQLGHQDVVTRLPADAVLLATSGRGVNQAFTFPGKPIYCTQFHPELDRPSLIERAMHYPEYVTDVAGVPLDTFAQMCRDTPEANTLLLRFVGHFLNRDAANISPLPSRS